MQRNKNLIKCVLILYVKKHELKADFLLHLNNLITQIFVPGEQKNLMKKTNHLLEIVEANVMIIDRLKNSTCKDWCTVLSEALLRIILLEMIELNAASTKILEPKETDMMELNKTTFSLFKTLRRMFKYVDSKAAATTFVNEINIFDVFRPCLSSWVNCTANEAKLHVQNLIKLTEEDLKKNPKTPAWYLNPETIQTWEENNVLFQQILQSCHKTWVELEWIILEENLWFGSELFCKANEICKEQYIEGINKIVMMDKEFDQQELVLCLITLYKVLNYLDPFKTSLEQLRNKGQIELDSIEYPKYKHFSQKISEAEESVHSKVLEMIDNFCSGQKEKFKKFIKDRKFFKSETDHSELDTDNLLGYLNELLKFIHQHLHCDLSDLNNDIDNDYSYKRYEVIITDKLFQILEDEMLKMAEKQKENKEILRKLFQYMMLFRSNFFFDESLKLKEGMQKLEIEQMDTAKLVNQFLNNSNLSEEDKRGNIKFKAWRQFDNLSISIKNVSELKAKPKKATLDFSITVSIHGIKQKHKTKMVKDVTNYIFDISESDNEEKVFTFDKTDSEQFLQIVLYDHSQKLRKYFRGIYFQPLHEIESNPKTQSKQFSTFPYLSEDHPTFPFWKELNSRTSRDEIAARIVKDINFFMHEQYKYEMN